MRRRGEAGSTRSKARGIAGAQGGAIGANRSIFRGWPLQGRIVRRKLTPQVRTHSRALSPSLFSYVRTTQARTPSTQDPAKWRLTRPLAARTRAATFHPNTVPASSTRPSPFTALQVRRGCLHTLRTKCGERRGPHRPARGQKRMRSFRHPFFAVHSYPHTRPIVVRRCSPAFCISPHDLPGHLPMPSPPQMSRGHYPPTAPNYYAVPRPGFQHHAGGPPQHYGAHPGAHMGGGGAGGPPPQQPGYAGGGGPPAAPNDHPR